MTLRLGLDKYSRAALFGNIFTPLGANGNHHMSLISQQQSILISFTSVI